ncbi:cell death abnormality protein 1-like [Dreissena polymorpha]|uniref:cell death abnormality protein 1-like n=1 Tax=Dreissena polymorpha TaxID=45954 RepID=UPI00226433F2|nr:cell death abnormality protein 1-like [Dreissena polymorpha]
MNLTLMYLILLFIVDNAKAQAHNCLENNNCRGNKCYWVDDKLDDKLEDCWLRGCNDGYWGPSCRSYCNDENCLSCDRKSGGLCSICKNAYYRVNYEECKSCENYTKQGCRCTSQAACNDCLEGYDLHMSYKTVPTYVCRACTDGRFGKRCTLSCSIGCSDVCNKTDGTCLCKPNYTGDKCETCNTGLYGHLCDKNCSTGCLSPCNNANGSCTCKQHFTGAFCESCINGWYGTECNQPCSNNCVSCHNASSCISCQTGKYGNICQNWCPRTCESCDSSVNCTTCTTGFYGPSCQINCSHGCANTTCDKRAGTCSSCLKGKTGQHCIYNCSEGCFDGMCTQYKGECSLGCKQGYYGNRCLSQCPINCLDCSSAEKCGTCELGYYGAYCQFSCSDGCAENYCHKQYGTCSPCVKSKTGKYCTANCSEGCLYESCNQNDGKCTHGCKQGFYGLTTCENHCPNKCVTCSSAKLCLTCANGYYGSRCGSQCPDTCQTCDEHGICLTCKVNYFDPDKKCQCLQGLCESIPCVACSNSTYYANEHSNTCCPCSSQCKHSLCSSAELCTHGCENGYFGTGCENVCSIRDQMCTICNENTLNTFVCTTCIDRFYPNSNRTCIPCSANCFEGNCNNSTGHCANGCKDGFWNFKCENTCLENCSVCDQDSGKCLICSTSSLHGIKCENTCNSKCTNKSCYMNGNCKSGCLSNYYGPSCDTQCPINCAQNGSESRCSSETGICMYGCNAGFTGGNCMADLKQGSSLDSIFAAAIGGGFAAVFIVVIVIVIGLVTFKRRKTRHPKTAIVRETSYDAAISVAPVYASVVRHRAVSVNTSSVKETSFGNVTNPVYTNILSDEHLAMANVTSEDSLEVGK